MRLKVISTEDSLPKNPFEGQLCVDSQGGFWCFNGKRWAIIEEPTFTRTEVIALLKKFQNKSPLRSLKDWVKNNLKK